MSDSVQTEIRKTLSADNLLEDADGVLWCCARCDNRYTQAPSHTSSALPTNLAKVDVAEYPLYAKATPIYVDLQPGEVLFMPAGYV